MKILAMVAEVTKVTWSNKEIYFSFFILFLGSVNNNHEAATRKVPRLILYN